MKVNGKAQGNEEQIPDWMLTCNAMRAASGRNAMLALRRQSAQVEAKCSDKSCLTAIYFLRKNADTCAIVTTVSSIFLIELYSGRYHDEEGERRRWPESRSSSARREWQEAGGQICRFARRRHGRGCGA